MARRTNIRDLAFRHNTKPGLGFEILSLAALFARETAGLLPESLFAPQRPQFHMVIVGTKGKGTLVVDFTPCEIGVGKVAVFAGGRIQQYRPAKGLDAYLLVFSPEFVALGTDVREVDPLRSPHIFSIHWQRPVITPNARDLEEIHALCEQLAAEHAKPIDAVHAALLSALLRAVLLKLERYVSEDAIPPAELQRFFTILERDIAKTRSVAHYAKAAGISSRRLGELLLAHTGRSTKQVLDERIVLEHKRLLAHTDISVKELADRTGFAEPTNLVKFFRHHTGMTPLEFRTKLPSGRRS
ncbi:MAG TPA: helix-turn-helix domain-containing protein [Kofleriaceae bacterium]